MEIVPGPPFTLRLAFHSRIEDFYGFIIHASEFIAVRVYADQLIRENSSGYIDLTF